MLPRFLHLLSADGGGGAAAPAAAPAPAAEPAAALAAAPAAAAPAPAAAAPAAAEPAAAPAASPAAAPAAAPSAPDSLLKPPPAAATAPAPAAPGDWATKVPEKFHVKTADGSLDMQATMLKQAESYTNLEKMRPSAPAAPSDYTYEIPEALKANAPEEVVTAAFRERMHKLGLTQDQFAGVMGEYFGLLPAVLDTALQTSVAEARDALSKVWTTPAAFEAGLSNAQRAIDGAPEAIRQQVYERFGRDPLFMQFAASFGAEMREDSPPKNADGGSGGPSEIDALMASEAYRNPQHKDHKTVSARVAAHFQSKYPGVVPA